MKSPNTSTDKITETAATNGGTRWPLEECFLLEDLDTLKKVRILKDEWLGVYQGICLGVSQGTPSRDLLCASRSRAILYRKLKGMALVFPLMVRRAPSKGRLPHAIEPSKPDHFTKLQRSAFEAIAKARSLLDPHSIGLTSVPLYGYAWFVYELMNDRLIEAAEAKALARALEKLCEVLLDIEERAGKWTTSRPPDYPRLATEFLDVLHTARERGDFRVKGKATQAKIDKFLSSSEERARAKFEKMRGAADFLRTVANEARSKGSKAGDRSTFEEIRKALRVFHRLANGEILKGIAQVAIDGQVDDAQSLKQYKLLERLTKRFGQRVAKAVFGEYGPNIGSLDYNHLFYALRDWPRLDRRQDRLALMEAARQGLPKVRLV